MPPTDPTPSRPTNEPCARADMHGVRSAPEAGAGVPATAGAPGPFPPKPLWSFGEFSVNVHGCLVLSGTPNNPIVNPSAAQIRAASTAVQATSGEPTLTGSAGFPVSAIERFWSRVDATPGHGPRGDCWLWTGAKTEDGYGVVSGPKGGPSTVTAHRFAWMVSGNRFGAPGLVICHSCDTPSCVNPSHLWEGTSQENSLDCSAKGRRKTRSKLSPDVVREIRASSDQHQRLAEKHSVSEACIRAARSGRTYRWVTP